MRLTVGRAAAALALLIPTWFATAPGTVPPCATEDSTDCYWNAAARGNGDGSSFIDVAGHRIYLP